MVMMGSGHGDDGGVVMVREVSMGVRCFHNARRTQLEGSHVFL